ncbi:hypothetical protein M8J76_003079 [Diaphorina citri]|nr:hypothetical protein M8J75_000372 [Diaphorina citri]KAI5740363.1 hypothetical protein M8J76_003079 [Diaphorina citri]
MIGPVRWLTSGSFPELTAAEVQLPIVPMFGKIGRPKTLDPKLNIPRYEAGNQNQPGEMAISPGPHHTTDTE